MKNRLFREAKRSADDSVASAGDWLTGVPAIVAENEDPERQHRVKVIIPSIDENLIFDEWVRQLVFCLGNGFGSAFIPPKGTEVILFGQLGQKYNMFYLPVYNEEMFVPEGFDDETTVGFKAPGNFHIFAEMLVKIQAQTFEVIASVLAKITGQSIEVIAQGLMKLTGQNIEGTASQKYKISGATIEVAGDTIKITGGTVEISGSSVKIQGRTVNTSGPPI